MKVCDVTRETLDVPNLSVEDKDYLVYMERASNILRMCTITATRTPATVVINTMSTNGKTCRVPTTTYYAFPVGHPLHHQVMAHYAYFKEVYALHLVLMDSVFEVCANWHPYRTVGLKNKKRLIAVNVLPRRKGHEWADANPLYSDADIMSEVMDFIEDYL